MTNNIIYDNSAVTGGGVYIYGGVLLNNTIVGNDANLEPESGRGGNVYANFPANAEMLYLLCMVLKGDAVQAAGMAKMLNLGLAALVSNLERWSPQTEGAIDA